MHSGSTNTGRPIKSKGSKNMLLGDMFKATMLYDTINKHEDALRLSSFSECLNALCREKMMRAEVIDVQVRPFFRLLGIPRGKKTHPVTKLSVCCWLWTWV